MKINIKYLLILTLIFIVFTAIGTVSHEFGHILVAKYFGYETTLHFGSMSYDMGQIVDYSSFFWIALGGPMQTMLTGLLGLLIVLYRKEHINRNGLKLIDWVAVFLSLFWLRQVFNVMMSIVIGFFSPTGSFFTGDEAILSEELNLWEGTITISLGLIGLLISVYIVFRIVPREIRFTFILSGLLGGILGFIFWMKILGPVLLP
ncbi:MAG: M50 family metallopeptidase [Chlorobiota bacterium]